MKADRIGAWLRIKAKICREQSHKLIMSTKAKGHSRQNDTYGLQWLFAAMVLEHVAQEIETEWRDR